MLRSISRRYRPPCALIKHNITKHLSIQTTAEQTGIGRHGLVICYLYNTKGIAAFAVPARKL